MSECKETECCASVHCPVCAHKKDFQAARNAVKNILVPLDNGGLMRFQDMSWIRPLNVECGYFYQDVIFPGTSKMEG